MHTRSRKGRVCDGNIVEREAHLERNRQVFTRASTADKAPEREDPENMTTGKSIDYNTYANESKKQKNIFHTGRPGGLP